MSCYQLTLQIPETWGMRWATLSQKGQHVSNIQGQNQRGKDQTLTSGQEILRTSFFSEGLKKKFQESKHGSHLPLRTAGYKWLLGASGLTGYRDSASQKQKSGVDPA